MPKKQAYSATEAGEILGCGRYTIYRMVKAGELRWTTIGRRKKILASTLNAYLKKQSEQ